MKMPFTAAMFAAVSMLSIAGTASAQTAPCTNVIDGIVAKVNAGSMTASAAADAISTVVGKLELTGQDKTDLTKAVADVKANPTPAVLQKAVTDNAGRLAGKQCPTS